MHIANKEKLEEKIEKWIRSISYETKEIVLTELIIRMMEIEEINWSDDRKCPYWDSSGDELGENK